MLRRNTIAYLALLDVADDENGLSCERQKCFLLLLEIQNYLVNEIR